MRVLVALMTVMAAMAVRADPPFVLEQDAVFQPAYGDQFYGHVCWGNNEYFAAWLDLRVGGVNPAGYDLYAQRVAPDGTIKDPGSLLLLRAGPGRTLNHPAVAWNGSVYLVSWSESTGVWCLRVSAQGQVLDPVGFRIDTLGNVERPGIASDGANFLVTYGTNRQVFARRVSGAGQVLDPQPLVIKALGTEQVGRPRAAFGGGEFMVAWAQAPQQAIRGARVTRGGSVQDAGGFNISGGPATDVDPELDFDGTAFFVTWQRLSGASGFDMWGVRVGAGGAPLGPGVMLTSGAPFGGVGGGHVAFNGTNHLVSITVGEPLFSNTDQYAQLVDGQGLPIGGPFAVSTIEGRSQFAYGLTSNGIDFFMLWEDSRNTPDLFTYYVYDTYGARISGAGQVIDASGLALSTGASWQLSSSTTFDGANYLTVFEDLRTGPPAYDRDLWAMFVSPAGQPLAASAFRVADGERHQQEPDAVFGGGQHFVVYETMVNGINQVRGSRILPGGAVLDPQGILIGSNEATAETLRPQVACNGQKYCVAWYDNYQLPGQQPMQFALVRFDGTVELGPVNIPNSEFAGSVDFDLASDGAGFMLSWVDDLGVEVTRISGSGAVPGTTTMFFTDLLVESTKIGWNGSSYLVLWRSGTFGDSDVTGRLVSATGTPLNAPFAVVNGAYYASPTGVLRSGADFLAMWVQRSPSPAGDFYDIQYTRVNSAGSPVGAPVVVHHSEDPGLYGGVSAASGPAAGAMTAFSPWTDMPYNGPRLTGRMFTHGVTCYANCDASTVAPVLNVADFTCFLQKFAAGDPYANCDQSTIPPVLNIADFTCFLQRFAAACS